MNALAILVCGKEESEGIWGVARGMEDSESLLFARILVIEIDLHEK